MADANKQEGSNENKQEGAGTNEEEDMVRSIERILGVVIEQRGELGKRGQDSEKDKKIDRINNNITTLQLEYKRLTGGFYTLPTRGT